MFNSQEATVAGAVQRQTTVEESNKRLEQLDRDLAHIYDSISFLANRLVGLPDEAPRPPEPQTPQAIPFSLHDHIAVVERRVQSLRGELSRIVQ